MSNPNKYTQEEPPVPTLAYEINRQKDRKRGYVRLLQTRFPVYVWRACESTRLLQGHVQLLPMSLLMSLLLSASVLKRAYIHIHDRHISRILTFSLGHAAAARMLYCRTRCSTRLLQHRRRVITPDGSCPRFAQRELAVGRAKRATQGKASRFSRTRKTR